MFNTYFLQTVVKKREGFYVTIARVKIYANQKVPLLHVQYSALIINLFHQSA